MGFLNPHARISRTKTAREREREKYAHIFIESYNTQGYFFDAQYHPRSHPIHSSPRESASTPTSTKLLLRRNRDIQAFSFFGFGSGSWSWSGNRGRVRTRSILHSLLRLRLRFSLFLLFVCSVEIIFRPRREKHSIVAQRNLDFQPVLCFHIIHCRRWTGGGG